jgi:UDP-N-acetylmuramoyl-tripeptide--D-alanyl-D-alanine ligase
VELGELEREENKKIGGIAAGNCDWAILVDPRRGPDIKEGLLQSGFPEERILLCADLNQGLAALRQIEPGMEKTALLLNDLTDNY